MTAIGEFITFTEAAQQIKSRPHVSTFYRWRTRGVNGIKLETVRIGGRRMLTKSALDKFIAAVTAAVDRSEIKCTVSTQRQKAIDNASYELDRRGA